MSGRLGIGVVLAVILGLLVAGCGGGSDDDGLSVKAFTKQANALCLENNRLTEAELLKAFGKLEDEKLSPAAMLKREEAVIVPILVDLAETLSTGIGKLEAPSEKETQVETMLSSYETWIKKATASPEKIVATNDIFNNARELAGKYGLAKCEQTPFEVPPLES